MNTGNTATAILAGLRQALPSVTTAEDGDNLAIHLASYFEPHIDGDAMDLNGVWKQGAVDAGNRLMDAIHAHYTPAITALHEEALRLTRQAARAEDLLVRLHDEGIVSEGQVAKATGLHRIEIRRRVDEVTARPTPRAEETGHG